MNTGKVVGFVSVIIFWIFMTFFCYSGSVAFDSTSPSGAMLVGFVLTSSMLGTIQLLKMLYDKVYQILLE